MFGIGNQRVGIVTADDVAAWVDGCLFEVQIPTEAQNPIGHAAEIAWAFLPVVNGYVRTTPAPTAVADITPSLRLRHNGRDYVMRGDAVLETDIHGRADHVFCACEHVVTTSLPSTCLHEVYQAGATDEHGNPVPEWADPVAVACFSWSPSSTELQSPPTGGDLISVDLVLVVNSTLAVDHRDRFTVDGRRFEALGLPKDYDHQPWGFPPDRKIIELQKVD